MSKRPHRVLDPANFWLYSLYVIMLSMASAAGLEVLKDFLKRINGQAESWGVTAHPPIVLADTCEVDIIRLKVEEARREAIEGYKIAEADIICDFTGMTKPVTAGMILACAPRGRRLQYLQGQYD